MRFPRGLPSNHMSVGLNDGLAGFSFHDLSPDTDCFYAMDVALLEKLVISSKETVDSDKACIFFYIFRKLIIIHSCYLFIIDIIHSDNRPVLCNLKVLYTTIFWFVLHMLLLIPG